METHINSFHLYKIPLRTCVLKALFWKIFFFFFTKMSISLINQTYLQKLTSSQLGKEYIKSVYCYPAHLTYMQRTSCEMPGWMKHELESRLPGEISITSEMQMIPPLWQKVKRD